MTSGIYKITNTLNGKAYIGSSKDVLQRFSDHKCRLRKGKHANSHLQNSWNKYGEQAFEFSIVEACATDAAVLIAVEQKHIDLLMSAGKGLGYNQRIVAETNLGCKFSASAKANMSAGRMGIKPSALSIAKCIERSTGNTWCKGRVPTPEQYAKMHVHALEIRKPIIRRSLDMHVIATYSWRGEAAEACSTTKGAIFSACQNGHICCGSYWHTEDVGTSRIKPTYFKAKHYKVEQRNLDGELISIWDNLKHASDGTGIKRTGISHCCYGRKKQSNGYIWSFIEPVITNN